MVLKSIQDPLGHTLLGLPTQILIQQEMKVLLKYLWMVNAYYIVYTNQ